VHFVGETRAFTDGPLAWGGGWVIDRRKMRTIGAIRIKRRFGNPLPCVETSPLSTGNTSRFRITRRLGVGDADSVGVKPDR